MERQIKEIDYTELLKELQKVEIDKKYEDAMDTKIVPYEIPEMYSLDEVIKRLAIIETEMDKLNGCIKKTDQEALAMDWKKIGRCINEAIFKFTRIYERSFE